MKRYSFDGIGWMRPRVRSGITAFALLCCSTQSATSHAALRTPDVLRIAGANTGDADLLSPVQVQDGLRIRVQDLESRHQMRAGEQDVDVRRDYRLDQPPPDADVPLPADASGGEIFEERLEEMP
jgi:hypothetical protein